MATSRDKSATGQEEPKVHELAGGWITERVGTPIPLFLKLAYVGFSLFGLFYLFKFSLGEVGHSTRGALVQQFNQMTEQPPAAWLVMIGAIIGLFVVGLLAFAFLAREEE